MNLKFLSQREEKYCVILSGSEMVLAFLYILQFHPTAFIHSIPVTKRF